MSGSTNKLAEGIERVDREGAGVLGIDIVRREDCADLFACALGGEIRAVRLLRAVTETTSLVRDAPPHSPMLCATCPRSMNDGRFAIAVVSAEHGDPVRGLALAVCTSCATSVPEITSKALGALRLIWPNLQPFTITHPEGGRA